jgi:hypothetical protein
MSTDPRHPDVGFAVEIDPRTAGLRPGRARLALDAIERSGRVRRAAVREIALVAGD